MTGQAPETMRVRDWVSDAAQAMDQAGLYFGHGTDNAWDEACWMVAWGLDVAPDFGDEVADRGLNGEAIEKLNAILAERISTRQPLAHLIGEAWLGGWQFKVNADVLVPRSPIAELIGQGFAPWVAIDTIERVLDVGTGCGCLACLTAKTWPHLRVEAVDISPAAVRLAEDNIHRLGLRGQVGVHTSDLFSALPGERFDVILANPPYVPERSMATLPCEYRHEPRLGLVAGEQGLDVVIPLVEQARSHLTERGVLIGEVGEAQDAFDAWAQRHRLAVTWLEFDHGGEGVFLVEAPALEVLAP